MRTPRTATCRSRPRPLIGREEVLQDLAALLDSGDARLVTPHRPGRNRKTRLAIEIAAARADRYADGVFFVDLSSERDAGGRVRGHRSMQ